MAKTVTCRACGTPFTPRPGRGRPRVNCYVCKPAMVNGAVITPEPDRPRPRPAAPGRRPAPKEPKVTAPPDDPDGPGKIETAVIKELTSGNRLDTVNGGIALRIARFLDDPYLTETKLGQLAAQLDRTLEKAMAGAQREPDGVDEFTRRLMEKAATA